MTETEKAAYEAVRNPAPPRVCDCEGRGQCAGCHEDDDDRKDHGKTLPYPVDTYSAAL